MTRKLRVGLIQMRSGLDPAANRAQAEPYLREAAQAGARLIVTPEMSLRLDRDRERMIAATLPEEEEPELRKWAGLARELGVWLVLGSAGVSVGADKIANRCIVYDPDGKAAARYDKINMFDVTLGGGEAYRESDTIAPGSAAKLVAGPMGAKIGLSICYDLRFPKLYRALGAAGAEILTVPSAFTRPTGDAHWEVLLRARAIENNAFVLAPAQGGRHEDGRSTWGRTMIVDPWGKVLGKLDHDEPGLLVADLDLDQVAAMREKIPAWRGGREFEGP